MPFLTDAQHDRFVGTGSGGRPSETQSDYEMSDVL
jgi:hypothetical protein